MLYHSLHLTWPLINLWSSTGFCHQLLKIILLSNHQPLMIIKIWWPSSDHLCHSWRDCCPTIWVDRPLGQHWGTSSCQHHSLIIFNTIFWWQLFWFFFIPGTIWDGGGWVQVGLHPKNLLKHHFPLSHCNAMDCLNCYSHSFVDPLGDSFEFGRSSRPASLFVLIRCCANKPECHLTIWKADRGNVFVINQCAKSGMDGIGWVSGFASNLASYL